LAIDSISGNARTALYDLWAQKIQAEKDAKRGSQDESGSQETVAVSATGALRVNAKGAGGGPSVGGAQETSSSDNEDEYTRQIKELQRQLKRIQQQIAKVQSSGLPAEQKAQQIQALNAQAVQIMGQIQKIMAMQAKAAAAAAGGGISATA